MRRVYKSSQIDPVLVLQPDVNVLVVYPATDYATAFRELLCGDLLIDHRELKVPKNKLMFFVSSTFTDTHSERNEIMSVIVPKLRELARLHSIDVMAVDLRYGIPDEATLMHTTWNDCSRELERCRTESGGIFFISLQSEKYILSNFVYKNV